MPRSKPTLRRVVVSDRDEVREAIVKLGLATEFTPRVPTDVTADEVRGAIVLGEVIRPWIAVKAARVIEVDFGPPRLDDTRSAARLVSDCEGCGAYCIDEVPHPSPATLIVNCGDGVTSLLRSSQLIAPNARVVGGPMTAGQLTDEIVVGPVPFRLLPFARYARLPRFHEARLRADLARLRSRGADISSAVHGEILARHVKRVVSYRVRLSLER